jgi:hypothetical protein
MAAAARSINENRHGEGGGGVSGIKSVAAACGVSKHDGENRKRTAEIMKIDASENRKAENQQWL